MDGFIWVIIIFSIVSAISFAFRQQNITQTGKDLAYQFTRIGTIVGKSKQEIIAFVGQPSSFSTMPEGKTLLQWQATGYHIALLFNGDISEDVTHEYVDTSILTSTLKSKKYPKFNIATNIEIIEDKKLHNIYRKYFIKKGLSVEHADKALKEDIQSRKQYRELFAEDGMSQEEADRGFENSIESMYVLQNTEKHKKEFRKLYANEGMSQEQADSAYDVLIKTAEAKLEIYREQHGAVVDEQLRNIYVKYFIKKGLSSGHADKALKEDIERRKQYRELFAKNGKTKEEADREFEHSIESMYVLQNTERHKKEFRELYANEGMSQEQADSAYDMLIKTAEARLDVYREQKEII